MAGEIETMVRKKVGRRRRSRSSSLKRIGKRVDSMCARRLKRRRSRSRSRSRSRVGRKRRSRSRRA